jgi:hypothetical protein
MPQIVLFLFLQVKNKPLNNCAFIREFFGVGANITSLALQASSWFSVAQVC